MGLRDRVFSRINSELEQAIVLVLLEIDLELVQDPLIELEGFETEIVAACQLDVLLALLIVWSMAIRRHA